MAFQIKDFTSIVAAMINHMRGTQSEVTDYNVGSVARTMIEAPAIEMDELYQQLFIGLKEAIPVATYNSFSFSLLPAVAASGLVRVVIAVQGAAVTIAAGTILTSPSAKVSYTSVQAVTIAPGGTTADVLAVASNAGSLGNLPAASSFTLSPSPAGFSSASNLTSFLNGSDEETGDERKQRFRLYIEALSRGTSDALIYGAKTVALYGVGGVEIERVKAASVIEPYLSDDTMPIALVEVYVHNGVGATSAGLVSRVAEVLYGYTDVDGNRVPGWQAAGADVHVYAAAEVVHNVSATLTASVGYSAAALAPLATAALNDYISGLDLGEPFVFAQAVYLVKSIEGVANILFDSSDDLTVAKYEKIIPGTVVVTPA